jgi:hypothetical protein
MKHVESIEPLVEIIRSARHHFRSKTGIQANCLYLGSYEHRLLLKHLAENSQTVVETGAIPRFMDLHVLRVNTKHHINVS